MVKLANNRSIFKHKSIVGSLTNCKQLNVLNINFSKNLMLIIFNAYLKSPTKLQQKSQTSVSSNEILFLLSGVQSVYIGALHIILLHIIETEVASIKIHVKIL